TTAGDEGVMSQRNDELRRTPLEGEHRALGAHMGAFAGWNMPIEYRGTLTEHRAVREGVGLFDLTHLGKIVLEGPGALDTLHWAERWEGGRSLVVSRSGYTGERGFELFVPEDVVVDLWRELLKLGEPLGMEPCGLGARDTLRLEMGYPLHGNDIWDEKTPLEA